MKWDGKFYFEWPNWMGVVYAVPINAIGYRSVVALPDGTRLRIIKRKDEVRVSEAPTRNRKSTTVFKAERFFDSRSEAHPTFAGDWKPLIKLVNAAAAVNTLFGVQLTAEEFQRLSANNEAEFEVLRRRFSPRAGSLLFLVSGPEENLSVELYRTGMCP